MKAYRFRLYQSVEQERLLSKQSELCRLSIPELLPENKGEETWCQAESWIPETERKRPVQITDLPKVRL